MTETKKKMPMKRALCLLSSTMVEGGQIHWPAANDCKHAVSILGEFCWWSVISYASMSSKANWVHANLKLTMMPCVSMIYRFKQYTVVIEYPSDHTGNHQIWILWLCTLSRDHHTAMTPLTLSLWWARTLGSHNTKNECKRHQ
jgi:hypothetical protein